MSAARAITCPNCGGSIAVKAAGYSVSVGCEHCGALLDVAHPDVAVIERFEGAMRDLAIPLGRRGMLFGQEWEAIGMLARTDGDANWTETLLFNPYLGYRWLVQSDDGWSFGTMVADRPDGVPGTDSVTWRGARYVRDYDPADTSTMYVVGEFYWRVKAGDRVGATTYSRGNEQLSAEWNGDEVNWTQLVPADADEVMAAFGLSDGKPGKRQRLAESGASAVPGFASQAGTAYADAGMARSDLPKMFGLAALTLLLSLLVMLAFGTATATVRSVATVVVDGSQVTTTIGQITINRPYQAVTIDAGASPFENRWIDLEYTLVNRQTQRGHTASDTIEHYAGVDSDGSWAEGSHSTATKFSGIPAGTYDVVANLQAHAWSGSSTYSPAASGSGWGRDEEITVRLAASAGGIMWSNLLLEMVLLLGLPVVVLWWRHDNDDDD